MAKRSSFKSKKKPFLQIILPIMVSFLVAIGPIAIQSLVTLFSYQDIPVLTDHRIDFTNKENTYLQGRYIYGDVEFFYNQWLYSDPLEEPESVPLRTPSPWTGHDNGHGGIFSGDGYASYRFYLTGLMPGRHIRAFQNIEIPNRIFLNGVLCCQTGEPSQQAQSTMMSVRAVVDRSIVVPDNGVIEYVMEVGNTGDGGCQHLGVVYQEGVPQPSSTQEVFFPIDAGFILAALIVAAPLIMVTRDKKRHLLLVAAIITEAFIYFSSMDSLFISAGFVFSFPVSEVIGLTAFCVMVALLIAYEYVGSRRNFNTMEMTAIMLGLMVFALGYTFSHGTKWCTLFIGFIATIPLYLIIKDWIAIRKGFLNLPSLALNSVLLAHALIVLGFGVDGFGILFTFYPTVSALLIVTMCFAIGFYDTFHTSLMMKDAAVLEHRYKTISNRALSRFINYDETIAILSMIEHNYDHSIEEGERALLFLSSLFRARLVALREPRITLERECELEWRIWTFLSELRGYSNALVLDVERGEFEVPSLIFEEAIAEIAKYLGPDDSIFIVECENGARLDYPEEILLQAETCRSIVDRCAVQGLRADLFLGSIFIYEEDIQ